MPICSRFSLLLVVVFFCVIRLEAFAQEKPAVVQIKTTGKFIQSNILVMIVSVEIPDNWILRAEDGFESMWQTDLDTVTIALKFRKSQGIELVERWKADRKPTEKGFYHKKVTFVQTIEIDTSKFPIFIDAELRWTLLGLDANQTVQQGKNCCLLELCKKRKKTRTISVGWNCNRREKVYWEDYKN